MALPEAHNALHRDVSPAATGLQRIGAQREALPPVPRCAQLYKLVGRTANGAGRGK
jgi:hypothetical protein